MKKIYTLFIICFGFSFTMMAQDQPAGDAGRLEAYKIAYLTKKLNLSPQEAQRFWPLYNQYQKELRSARVDNRQQKNEIQMEEKILDIKKKYDGQFSKALDKDKVNTLYRSEREFNMMVQKELMERRQQRMPKRKKN